MATPQIRFLDRRTPPHIVTLVLLAGLSSAAMNIFLPSLPSMAAHYDASYATLQMSVTFYLAVNAVLQIFIGPLSDRLGRRPVLLGAVSIFIVVSAAIPFAPNVEIFLALRMVQSVVVAGLVLSRAIVRDTFPQDQAASRIGYVTMGMALVPMVAPVVGGILDEVLGWQATFAFLTACGCGVLWLVWRDLGETAAGGGMTLRDQLREAPELLRSPRFWGYSSASMFAAGAFFAYLGGAPYVGSEVFGMSSAMLGFAFGAPAVGYVIGNGLSGLFSARFGINAMILTGTLLSAGGVGTSLIVFYAGDESIAAFFGFMVFVGLGNGLVVPNATSGMLSVRPRLAGTASGLGGAMMIGGGAILSALAAVLLERGEGAYPLSWTMFATSLMAVVAILAVYRRDRQIARSGAA